MTPATGTILKALTAHLKANSVVGEVVLGGFERTAGGKELVERIASDKLLIIVGVDPVNWTEPTQATREFARWQEQMTLSIIATRRLKDGADVYGTRFDDGDWLGNTMADFCNRLADPRTTECQDLSDAGIGIVRATMVQSDYSPGDGADLDAGFVSVGATVEIHAEVVPGESPLPAAQGGLVVSVLQFRVVHGVSGDTVPLTAPNSFLLGAFSLYQTYKLLAASPRFRVCGIEIKALRVPCDVPMTFTVTIAGIGGAPNKVYTVGVPAGVQTALLEPMEALDLADYQDVRVEASTDTPPGVAPEGIEVWITTEYVP